MDEEDNFPVGDYEDSFYESDTSWGNKMNRDCLFVRWGKMVEGFCGFVGSRLTSCAWFGLPPFCDKIFHNGNSIVRFPFDVY